MYEEDIAACKAMGAFGAELLPDEGGVLTHCNAGALATCGYGTALGVIRAAVEQGKQIHVYADETRPFLQGARLTAWELMADGIPTTVICDNMAASLMRAGQASRPWWWARTASPPTATWPTRSAPTTWRFWRASTAFRFTWPRRGPPSIWLRRRATRFPSRSGRRCEVTHHGGKQLTPHGVGICNPAFDVTPAKYIDRHHHRARCAARAVCGVAARDGTGCRLRPAGYSNRSCLSAFAILQIRQKSSAARHPVVARGHLLLACIWRGFRISRTFTARAGRFAALFIAAWGMGETARCLQRKWSLYHAGVLILLYADLMILAMIVFLVAYP